MRHVRKSWWAPLVAFGAVLVAADAGHAQSGGSRGTGGGRQQPSSRNASMMNTRGGKGNCQTSSLSTANTPAATPQLSTTVPVSTTADLSATTYDPSATGTTQSLTARQRKLLQMRLLQLQQMQLQQMQLQLTGGASR